MQVLILVLLIVVLIIAISIGFVTACEIGEANKKIEALSVQVAFMESRLRELSLMYYEQNKQLSGKVDKVWWQHEEVVAEIKDVIKEEIPKRLFKFMYPVKRSLFP